MSLTHLVFTHFKVIIHLYSYVKICKSITTSTNNKSTISNLFDAVGFPSIEILILTKFSNPARSLLAIIFVQVTRHGDELNTFGKTSSRKDGT